MKLSTGKVVVVFVVLVLFILVMAFVFSGCIDTSGIVAEKLPIDPCDRPYSKNLSCSEAYNCFLEKPDDNAELFSYLSEFCSCKDCYGNPNPCCVLESCEELEGTCILLSDF